VLFERIRTLGQRRLDLGDTRHLQLSRDRLLRRDPSTRRENSRWRESAE
jgi:hypothetical protein